MTPFLKLPAHKYRPFPPIDLPDRRWPSRVIDKAPMWCSVDLRDGNQALIEPMGPERKRRMFDLLVRMGFKEIEVGFPSASQTDFDFVRQIIEEKLIPDDVTIQVLTQAREELIRRTFESIKGARRAVLHLYNSTSTLQRRVVFGLDRQGIVDIAVNGAKLVRSLADEAEKAGTKIVMQYSPESFTGTELDFAIEICERVMDVWGPTKKDRIIFNLPATVEMATPNVYADQIEWFSRKIKDRDKIILSLHPHNDRGTGVAAAELGIMAGADRIEGTLFGNGERTGNVDVVTLALNMYSQGVDPELGVGDIDEMKSAVEYCNQLPVHPRHPYAGELVFTAVSGSHQDAIKKGFAALEKSNSGIWEVPYLPIDPKDLGRDYQAVIRINSQSGKGGVAYVLEHEFGYSLPKLMHKEIGKLINDYADTKGTELTVLDIHDVFRKEYLERTAPLTLQHFKTTERDSAVQCEASVTIDGDSLALVGEGNGPIDAFVRALGSTRLPKFEVLSYSEHSLGKGAEARAVSYIQIKTDGKQTLYGAGIDTNIELASIKAIVSALNRALAKR